VLILLDPIYLGASPLVLSPQAMRPPTSRAAGFATHP